LKEKGRRSVARKRKGGGVTVKERKERKERKENKK
jgi:hypothetical protein